MNRKALRTYGLLVACLIMVFGVNNLYQKSTLAKSADRPEAIQIVETLERNSIHVTDVTIRMAAPSVQLSSPKELATLHETWSSRLQITPDSLVEHEKGAMIYQNTVVFPTHELHYRLAGVPHSGKWDVYLVVTVKGNRSHLQDVVTMQKTIVDVMRKHATIPQISTCIAGIDNDTLSVDQQEDKVFSLFRELRANEVERLVDESVVSISGYTRLWDQAIRSHDKKINLQVAAHRDFGKQMTRFTVGTPIITAEY
ncbi:MAG: YwmB family TATA-box binding protein [Clostridia bacterium]